MRIEKGAANRRSAPLVLLHEVTVHQWGLGRLLLFIIRLENQGDQSDQKCTEHKNICPCNFHIVHPLSFDWGQEVLPPKEGNKPPARGASRSESEFPIAGGNRTLIYYDSARFLLGTGFFQCVLGTL